MRLSADDLKFLTPEQLRDALATAIRKSEKENAELVISEYRRRGKKIPESLYHSARRKLKLGA